MPTTPISSFHQSMSRVDWNRVGTYVEVWSRTNNLTFNRAKSLEIVFTDKRHKQISQQPPTLPCICRVDVIKILGDTISSTLSIIHAWTRRQRRLFVLAKCSCPPYCHRVGDTMRRRRKKTRKESSLPLYYQTRLLQRRVPNPGSVLL